MATTEIVPEFPGVTEIELVVLVPDHPEGKVHVYEVTDGSFGTVYVSGERLQISVFPVIVDGWFGGGVMLTGNEIAAELPHALFAVTEIVPLELPAVT